MLALGNWIPVKDGDPRAVALYREHYSAKNVNHGMVIDYCRLGFSGIGESLILLTVDCLALFGWRRQKIADDGQIGVNCFVFRNTSGILSSELIQEADELAWNKWAEERHYTYVDAEKTAKHRSRHSEPGQCFIQAGWRWCGISKSGLVILERMVRPGSPQVVRPGSPQVVRPGSPQVVRPGSP